MANETDECPWCGSGKPYVYDKGTQWDCLAWKMADGSEIRTEECKRREATTLRQQLAAVTAERDELKKQKELDDYHILKLQGVLEGSTKRNRQKRETIKTLQDQVGELRCRIDEAPVWWFNPTDLGEPIAMIWEAAESPAIRVRLVRDDQPEEAVK